MSEVPGLQKFLGRVRRRAAANLVLAEAAFAAALALGGGVLLLLAGTQILNWYWPLALLVVAFLLGLYRMLRRMPSDYALAQRADRRLDLHDALSTAFILSQPGRNGKHSEAMVAAQREQVEALAPTLTPELAAPLQRPRSAMACAGLAVAFLSLMGVRYGVLKTLDLRPPLARGLVDMFTLTARYSAAAPEARKPPQPDWKQMGLAVDPETAAAAEKADSAVTPTPAAVPGEDALAEAERGRPGAGEPAGLEPDPLEGGDEAVGKGADGDPAEGDSASGKSQQPPDSQGRNNAGQGGENSSLLDKLRDAMANMLNKLNIKPPPGDGQRTVASASKNGQPSGMNRQGAGQPSPQGRSKGEGEPSADAQGEQQGDSAESGKPSSGKGGERGAERQASPDAKSGIGKEDGDKGIKEAEQLAAMGKLSEILGKRAANLTGEILVEVPGGKQQLKTPYSQRQAAHADMGGEIHRDEVPLVYQSFVQQYYEELRKTAPKETKP